jgi:hypothetical protein
VIRAHDAVSAASTRVGRRHRRDSSPASTAPGAHASPCACASRTSRAAGSDRLTLPRARGWGWRRAVLRGDRPAARCAGPRRPRTCRDSGPKGHRGGGVGGPGRCRHLDLHANHPALGELGEEVDLEAALLLTQAPPTLAGACPARTLVREALIVGASGDRPLVREEATLHRVDPSGSEARAAPLPQAPTGSVLMKRMCSASDGHKPSPAALGRHDSTPPRHARPWGPTVAWSRRRGRRPRGG